MGSQSAAPLLPQTDEYLGVPEPIGTSLWRQRHLASGCWHRFKVGYQPRKWYFLHNEAYWLQRLSAMPVAGCYGVHGKGNERVLITDYLPGDTLASLIRYGRVLTPQLVLQQLFDVLERCHRQGVVHADIKPGNLLLHEQTLYVLDFGSAIPSGTDMTWLPYRSFSPSYSLPEQQQGRGVIEPMMDWYAYLVILRLVLGGGLARPDWRAQLPTTSVFAEWIIASGLPLAMRMKLLRTVQQLDRRNTSCSQGPPYIESFSSWCC